MGFEAAAYINISFFGSFSSALYFETPFLPTFDDMFMPKTAYRSDFGSIKHLNILLGKLFTTYNATL